MYSKLKYFVLALFLDAVASNPYNIRYNNPEADLYPKNEDGVQIRNEEGDLSRSLPSFMSPVPSALDSDPRSLYTNDKEYSRTNEQLPSEAQSTRNNANPSLNGNKVLSHLLRLKQPIINNVVESSTPVDSTVIKNQIYGENFRQLPLYNNVRSEALSRNNHYEPVNIQSAPDQRIAFQLTPSPDVRNLDAYRPATPVRNFDIDREWSNYAREQPKLPDFIADRLRHPVDFQRSQINGQQVHKPLYAERLGTSQQHNIQKIINDQRIQNVLSSTKQTKRYLVIHPDGTVEHVDNLEPIAARHPNYVLVNAGHVVPANNSKTDVNIDEISVQVPVPTLEPISSSKVPVVSKLQLPEPLIKNEEAVVDIQTSSPETSTIVEPAPSSESPINPEPAVIVSSTIVANKPSSSPPLAEPTSAIDEINQESEVSEKSLENKDVSEIDNNTSLKSGFESSEGVGEIDEGKENEVESLSVTPIPISTELITENDVPEVIPILANEVENAAVADALVVVPENTSENESDLVVQSTRNIENTEDAETDDIIELDSVGLGLRRVGKPMIYYTSDPDFWTKVTDGKDSNFIYFFHVKSSPRVEKDRQRTIYPDGTILEELTETVWDGEGGEPKVTKSSKYIRPDDL